MFNEERMVLDRCIECGKEVAIGEKVVLIYEDSLGKYWAHVGECFTSHSKSLADPEDMKRGFIIGICGRCGKPVRDEELYVAERLRGLDEYAEYMGCTTFPRGEDIGFHHKECPDKVDKSPT